jgi:hypothetical protein
VTTREQHILAALRAWFDAETATQDRRAEMAGEHGLAWCAAKGDGDPEYRLQEGRAEARLRELYEACREAWGGEQG